jgi:hypothetical protein
MDASEEERLGAVRATSAALTIRAGMAETTCASTTATPSAAVGKSEACAAWAAAWATWPVRRERVVPVARARWGERWVSAP